jgi:putative hydrolase of the HAD superfamily
MRTTDPFQVLAVAARDVRVVLFDLGGVLVQLGGVATILEWTGQRISAEDLGPLWLRSPSVRAFETGRLEPLAFAAGMLAELNLQMEPQRFLDAFTAWPTGLYPGALEMIASIPRRYTRAVLSNSNSLHWSRVMNEMQVGPAFDHHFASHLIGKIKPDAEAFHHVLESLGSKPHDVLFLDDNLLNVDAARALGMHAILVRGAAEAPAECRRCASARHARDPRPRRRRSTPRAGARRSDRTAWPRDRRLAAPPVPSRFPHRLRGRGGRRG